MSYEEKITNTLGRILLQEKNVGFDNSVVIGGLDEFLVANREHLRELITLNSFSYSTSTLAERRAWAERLLTGLKDLSTSKFSETAKTLERERDRPRSMRIPLAAPIMELKRPLTDKIARLLEENMGIKSVWDLVSHYPSRHDDFTDIRKINELEPRLMQSVVATVWDCTLQTSFKRNKRVDLTLFDDTGNVKITLFNQVWAANQLKQGMKVMVSGRAAVFNGKITFESPTYEVLKQGSHNIHTGRLVPIYPLTAGVTQKVMRRIVNAALSSSIEHVKEFMPSEILLRTGLMGLKEAVAHFHYPRDSKELMRSRRRLAFDELFMIQLVRQKQKVEWKKEVSAVPLIDEDSCRSFISEIPFTLTKAQLRAINEVLADLNSNAAMRRLLQGDVGSGKTVVAACAMVTAASSGKLSALMAPTEILAEQHFVTLIRLLDPHSHEKVLAGDENVVELNIGRGFRKITLALLVGSLPEAVKRRTRHLLAAGEIDVIVGTHTLIQDSVELRELALLVVDEQHRFGILQRSVLQEKEPRPHLLVMSATPIPRSLHLTMVGDLDLSVIDELPTGRKPIRTIVESPSRRNHVYSFIRNQVAEGRQAFIVFPLIDESALVQARSAIEEHLRLSKEVFQELTVGLIHGRMTLSEKEVAMEKFRRGETHILVATAVVEVGVDVPNASVMLIDGADRFGLSQLHQFRGRIGRGKHQSHCILISDKAGEDAKKRMDILRMTTDGFKLAEEDLKMRGYGDFLGTRQSGQPIFKVAQISDTDLVSLVSLEAKKLLETDANFDLGLNSPLKERYEQMRSDLRVN